MVNFTAAAVILGFSFAAFASPLAERDFEQFQKDLTRISMEVTGLRNTLEGIPDHGVDPAVIMQIHLDSVNLATTITNGAKDLEGNEKMDQSTAQAILIALEAIEPPIEDSLKLIVEKKDAISEVMPGTAMVVRQDLLALKGATGELFKNLTGVSPENFVPLITAIGTRIQGGFLVAIAAYQ